MASWSSHTYVGAALDETGRKMTQCDRILWTLSDGAEHSHHEFYGWCVLHSRIAELRERGHQIEVRRDGDNYLYRLVGSNGGDLAAERKPLSGDDIAHGGSHDSTVSIASSEAAPPRDPLDPGVASLRSWPPCTDHQEPCDCP